VTPSPTARHLQSLDAGRGGGSSMTVLLASARTEIAGYLSTLIYVYTLLIVLYIVTQLLFAFGVRPPYSRATDAVLTFLRDVCEPYLRIFRRIIPMVGAFDFSPIVAIIVLSLVGNVIVSLIHG
jgi:YggT family protein